MPCARAFYEPVIITNVTEKILIVQEVALRKDKGDVIYDARDVVLREGDVGIWYGWCQYGFDLDR